MIKFIAKGIDDLLKKIDGVKQRLDDKNLLQEVGQIELQDIRTRIGVSKITPDGKPWAPWAPSTFVSRLNKGNTERGLLFDSGRLLDSFRVINDGKTVTIGTNVPYAPYLNNGTGKMPARQFMGVSEGAKKQIQAILASKIGLPPK